MPVFVVYIIFFLVPQLELFIAADAFSVDISYLNILPQYMYILTELEHTLTSHYVNINLIDRKSVV